MASNLGQFAGNFLQAFSQARQSKQQQEQDEKFRRLQAKLIEQSIASNQRKIDAQTTFGELLTGARPSADVTLLDPRTGQPEAPAEVPRLPEQPLSLTEALADPEGFMAAMESGRFPQLQAASQLQARSDFVESLRESGMSPQEFLRTSEGAAQAFEAGAPATLFQERAEPSMIRMMRAAGIDPESDRGREMLLQNLTAQGASDQLMRQIQLQIESLKLNQLRREREQQEASEQRQMAEIQDAIETDFSNAREIIQLQEDLRNSALNSGVPYGDFWRTLQAGGTALFQLAGFDRRKAQEMIAKRDRLNKLFATGTIDALDKLAGSGSITNMKFEALRQATPTITNNPQANAALLADRMEAALQAADREGIEVENREAIETFIDQNKGIRSSESGGSISQLIGNATGAAQETAERVSLSAEELAQMGLDQFRQISAAEIAQFTDEQRQAFNERLQELRQAGGEAVERVGESVENILRMSLEQIRQIDSADVKNFTEAQRRALDERLKELGF